MNRHRKIDRLMRLVVTTLLGGLLLAIVKLVFQPNIDWTKPKTYTDLVPSIVAGSILGWMYGLTKEMSTLLGESTERLDKVTHTLDFQQEAIQMLLNGRHRNTLTSLLMDSLQSKCRYIAFVDENQYLSYLKSAIEESNCYQGIQRNSVRWFNEEAHLLYLRQLKDKTMKNKIRIFVVDDENEIAEDLRDLDLMRNYWENTGQNVETYWISRQILVQRYPGLKIPEDYALYDKELIIKYNSDLQTLSFDILQGNYNGDIEIFQKLDEQKKLGVNHPFQKINP